MTFKKLSWLVLLILLVPSVLADPSYTFKQHEETTLKVSCFDANNTLCNSAVNCYVTVQYPDLSDLIKNGTMDFHSDYYSYNLTSLNQTGIYSVISRCEGATSNAFSSFTFEVTPTGKEQTSILDNPMLIVLGLFAILLVGMGAYFGNAWFGFIGAIMFLLGGVYTMIYGFNNITDFYTRGIGVTFLGLGLVFMFSAAYEWVWGSNE